MRRFAYCSNTRERLKLGTPVASVATEGLYIVNSAFDGDTYSLGWRMILKSVTGSQTLLENSEASVAKNINWYFMVVDDDLKFFNAPTGAITIFEGLQIDHEYGIWVYVDYEDLYVFVYDRTTGILTEDTLSITAYAAADSLLSVLSDRNHRSPVVSSGTLWDLTWIGGGGSYPDLFLQNGLAIYQVSFYFPMREGSGTSCIDVKGRLQALSTGGIFPGGIHWTGVDIDPTKRWQ
jgi:hypothetical protein